MNNAFFYGCKNKDNVLIVESLLVRLIKINEFIYFVYIYNIFFEG